jgi:hypothetical protein
MDGDDLKRVGFSLSAKSSKANQPADYQYFPKPGERELGLRASGSTRFVTLSVYAWGELESVWK